MKQEMITVRVTYPDKEKAKWFWDIFKEYPKEVNGIKISAMSNGDMFEELNATKELCKIYESYISSSFPSVIFDGSYEDDELEEDELEVRLKIRKLKEEIKKSRERIVEIEEK